MAIVPGASFGRFRILHQLGAGAMGEVWLAEDPQIERQLAIKTVRVARDGDPPDPDLRARLLQEAKAAGRLVHPHVVTLFEAGEIEGVFFLAFEYVAGSDLSRRMRRTPPLTVEEILRIAREAAAGLGAAHRRGIVHRDVKPSNLLLTEDDTVKISDFGIAKLAGAGTDLTQSGILIGTPQYLSPEQVQGGQLDGRSDLFSLGAVLYELLSRRKAFTGDTLTSLIYEIVSRHPPAISMLRPDLPPRLGAAVMRLLEKDREARFPNADALAEELTVAAQELAAMRAGSSEPVPSAGVHPLRATQEHAPTLLVPRAARPEPEAEPSRRASVFSRAGVPLLLSLAVAAVVTGMVLQGIGEENRLRGSAEQQPATATELEAPRERAKRAESGGSQQSTAPAIAPAAGGDAAPTPETSRLQEGVQPSSQRRTVGGAVTFAITPPEASRQAIVRVDGLVRGPATGSVHTLRPGEHRIEILADGFAPLVLVVDSRPGDGGRSRLELEMTRE